MNEYEILLMLDAEIPEERGTEILARVRERIEGDGGTWDSHEPWGRRKLAYEIGHKGEGVYHLGFEVADCDAGEAYGREHGLDVIARGRRADRSGFTYFDTREGAGVTLEIRRTQP